MQFLKKRFCDRIISGLILAILFLFSGGFYSTGVVKASESESDVDRAGDWEFRDLDGKKYKLEQFKGKVIFLNIWATWCGPCIVEMKDIQKLHDAFKNEDVAFLIASNENKETVKNFYKEGKYTFPVYLINRSLPEPFRSPVIPSTFIIDRKGKTALKIFRTADWNSQSVHEYIRNLLSSEIDSSKIAKPFSDSESNMDVSEMMKEQQLNIARSMAASRIEPFAKRNNLSPDTKEKLINIRVDEQLKMSELMSGNNPSSNLMYERNKVQSDSDEKFINCCLKKIMVHTRDTKDLKNSG